MNKTLTQIQKVLGDKGLTLNNKHLAELSVQRIDISTEEKRKSKSRYKIKSKQGLQELNIKGSYCFRVSHLPHLMVHLPAVHLGPDQLINYLEYLDGSSPTLRLPLLPLHPLLSTLHRFLS